MSFSIALEPGQTVDIELTPSQVDALIDHVSLFDPASKWTKSVEAAVKNVFSESVRAYPWFNDSGAEAMLLITAIDWEEETNLQLPLKKVLTPAEGYMDESELLALRAVLMEVVAEIDVLLSSGGSASINA